MNVLVRIRFESISLRLNPSNQVETNQLNLNQFNSNKERGGIIDYP